MRKLFVTLAALAALGAAGTAPAQSTRDDTELLISQIQADKRAVILQSMELSDAQVRAFTPLYDDYQREMKDLMTRSSDVINKFAANYGSMTNDAAKDIMKEFFAVRDDRNEIMKKYAKKFARVLPATKVLQWVQVENKLNTLLDVQAARIIPVSR
jgi:phage host-nuclease inhibitor protein Gam